VPEQATARIRGVRITLVRIAFVLLTFALPQIEAAEVITRFDSAITVNPDASITVRETIVVRAEGNNIRRGIFRDFPTTYKDRYGNRVRVDVEVLAVKRDGADENYRIEPRSNGIRIRIGHADRMLTPGSHSYLIDYRTTRQLGFFPDFDELYWNVTGNGWAFPIESASASVTLPTGARTVRKAAYTGRQGDAGQDYLPLDSPGDAAWQTTRTLQPGEGLTIAIAWPKGFVAMPTFRDKARWFVRDNAGSGAALGGLGLVLFYYLWAWRRHGRDPEPGTVIPRFKPPKGLSPAATRFIRLMNFDRKAYSAALIDMAVKKFLTIEETGDKGFRLTKTENADLSALANGERRIAKHLLHTANSFLLDQDNHATLRASIKKLRLSLEAEYEHAAFARNTHLFIAGLLISAAVLVATVVVTGGTTNIVVAFLIAAFAAIPTFIALRFWGDDRDVTFKIFPFNSMPTMTGMATFLKFGLMLLFASLGSIGAVGTEIAGSPLQAGCFALLGGLNIAFFFLLKRPTLAGRQLMDEIEGFRMYLKTAEEERLKFFHPPEKTPELFEKYLPYAMALDVENEWNEKFAAVLAAASTEAYRGSGYRPSWYRGTRWQPGRSISTLGSSLGSAVAASARPPGSSSGSGGYSSGGGGFSGGGGGGGGGGGW